MCKNICTKISIYNVVVCVPTVQVNATNKFIQPKFSLIYRLLFYLQNYLLVLKFNKTKFGNSLKVEHLSVNFLVVGAKAERVEEGCIVSHHSVENRQWLLYLSLIVKWPLYHYHHP